MSFLHQPVFSHITDGFCLWLSPVLKWAIVWDTSDFSQQKWFFLFFAAFQKKTRNSPLMAASPLHSWTVNRNEVSISSSFSLTPVFPPCSSFPLFLPSTPPLFQSLCTLFPLTSSPITVKLQGGWLGTFLTEKFDCDQNHSWAFRHSFPQFKRFCSITGPPTQLTTLAHKCTSTHFLYAHCLFMSSSFSLEHPFRRPRTKQNFYPKVLVMLAGVAASRSMDVPEKCIIKTWIICLCRASLCSRTHYYACLLSVMRLISSQTCRWIWSS